MLLNVILNNINFSWNNPVSEHLPVSDGEENGFYNKKTSIIKCCSVLYSLRLLFFCFHMIQTQTLFITTILTKKQRNTELTLFII